MAGLPKGLLKEVIEEGYDPPEAMKEAWRRVKVQKKRYAARMSHGGEYPLGYKGKNPGQTLSEWEDHWRLKAVRQKNGRTYIPGAYRLERRAEKDLYNLSDFIVSSNVAGTIWLIPRKNPNPKISFSKWLTVVEREFDLAGVHLKWSGFTAKKFYKVYSPKKAAELLILESKRRRKTKVKKNPIAVFNPGGGTLIYGRVLELRAVKTSGKHRGERYRHTFGPHVQAIGFPNGSVLLKSNNGARLWKSV